MQNDDQRRSSISKTALIGDSQIPSALGQTITGALANIPFPFGIDSDGNYGYKKAGADTVVPFSSGGGYACITTGYDTYAYPIGEDYNPAVFSRNSAANYTSNVDGDMYVIFTSMCMTSVSFNGSVSVNNTIVYTAPNWSQVTPQLSSAIPIHKGDVISITGGTSAYHNFYVTTLYVK